MAPRVQVFKASADLMGEAGRAQLAVHRGAGDPDRPVDVRGVTVGGGRFAIIAGPCAVESEAQLDRVAGALAARGVRLLRGGVYKPRTSP